jgi:NHL repeat
MGVMVARRLSSIVVVLLCGLCWALAGGVGVASAEYSSIGENGSDAGQFNDVAGVAVDQSTGDLYALDGLNHRVQKFTGSGAFLLGWGWEVDASEPRIEMQTCTVATGCREGREGSGAGEFASGVSPESGVAVDNNSSLTDSSSGDVYVVDFGNFRVEKFDASGKFLLMFGGGVNKNGSNVCTAAEANECQRGTPGTGSGQFEWATESYGIVGVGPGGLVYVGDKARVEVFEPSGAWRENISLASLSAEGKVRALAVDSAGDVFVKDEGVPGVREIEPGGIEAPVVFDVGSEGVEGLTLDGSGDLFVSDSTGGFHVDEYVTASGEQLESFASKAIGSLASHTRGIAFSGSLGEVYLADNEDEGPAPEGGEHFKESVRVVPLPQPGPLVVSETASAGSHGAGSLEAVLNAEGAETSYHFEYVSQPAFETGGFASAVSTPAATLPAGFEDQTVSAGLSGLAPGVYHYRVVASNSKGSVTGPDQTFTTVPLEGPSATGVAGSSVTLSARVNPLGSAAEYRFEYGTSTAYGQVLSGSLGEGSEYVPVTRHVQELQPATEYHYRLVVVNEFGTFEGPDRVFVTQIVGSALTLPDGRAWELVSPADKKGAIIEPAFPLLGQIKAANTGNAITYTAAGPHVGENPKDGRISQVFSTREAGGGWRSRDITLSARVPAAGEQDELLHSEQLPYPFFSEDLSLATIFSEAPRTSGVTEGTWYLRNNLDGSFSALVSGANVSPAGTEYGGGSNLEFQIQVLAVTPDLSHVVFESPLALVPPAVSNGLSWNLYEWGAGHIQLLNILPDDTVATSDPTNSGGQFLAGEGSAPASTAQGGVRRAVSNDGRRVAWTWGFPYGGYAIGGGFRGLYVRDTVEGRTVRIGGSARLQMISGDGSRVLYLDGGELYAYDFVTGATTDLTSVHGAGQTSAAVQELVLGGSEDGSTVYFMANGVLSTTPNARGEKATPGKCVHVHVGGFRQSPPGATCNLYVVHEEGGSWGQPRFIATLSAEDEPNWYASTQHYAPDLARLSARVSPNGRYLVFDSDRSLTGYDNADAVSGRPDEEVFRYDLTGDRLVCVSCNPTGARPVGVDDARQSLLVDRPHAWLEESRTGPTGTEEGHWLAGNLPTWQEHMKGGGTYQPRSLLDDGRVFFNSPDGLVPQATNGLEDVYEYEPPAGPGMPASDSCTTSSATYSPRSDGCVSLVSSGTSSGESVFYDASENGNDVFFLTTAKLAGEDYDTGLDVYDAHVCSSGAPCRTEVVGSPPCTSGDSCKPASAPQPELFGPAPSATFKGVGNVIEQPKVTVKHKKAKRHAKHHKKKHKKKRRGRKASRSTVGRASGKGRG